jgi:hypothetical protein
MAIITLNNNSLSSISSLPAGVGGKVLQVVQGTSSTEFAQSSPTDGTIYYPSSNKLTATITPSSSSSKILINYISTARMDNNNSDPGVALALKESISGGSTTTYQPSTNAYASGLYLSTNTIGIFRIRLNYIVYSTPSTTNEITYEVGVYGYSSTQIKLNVDNSEGKIILT